MKIERITLPTFDITAKPQVKWSDLNIRRYAPFNRAKDRLWQDTNQSIWEKPAEESDDAVFFISQPQYVGKMPVRTDVQVNAQVA